MIRIKQIVTYAGAFILIAAALMFFRSTTTYSFDPVASPKGWIWNAYQFADSTDVIGLGWTSMNCLNDFDNDGELEYRCDPQNPYGMEMSVTGGLGGDNDYVGGCAWSSSFGWVCFNGGAGSTYQCDSDAELACSAVSHSGVLIEDYPNGSGANALFYYLSSPTFDGSSWAAPNSNQRAVVVSLYNGTTPEESYIGFPFMVNGSTTDGLVTGCFGCNSTTGSCDACLNTSTLDEDPVTNPGPNLLCMDCSSCTIGNEGGRCSLTRELNTCTASSCSGGCSDYTGVIVNEYETGQYELCGWGYNASDTGTGLGWVAFNSEPQIGDQAYVDVQEGSILSRGTIYSPDVPPIGRTNAAYLIEASGDIVNWFSKNALTYANQSPLPAFLTDTGGGVYKNVMGELDYTGLVTAVESGAVPGGGGPYTNKYGSSLVRAPVNIYASALNSRVYYFPDSGGRTIAGGTFPAGSGTSGAGIIIIEDDLTITGNIVYSTASVSKLSEIPSIVWIIKGDVTINPSVTDISGTFIILGDGSVSCPVAGCGRFSTGASDTKLTVHGSVLAKQFIFERSYGAAGDAAEEFVPEGRLQANPPRGLTDFSKSIPRFSSY